MSNGVEKREQWGSKLGFVLAAAGSAIGLGNIWRFPYVTGQNGGAAFVILYLLLVFLIGASVMLGEFAMGRAGGLDAVGTYKKLGGSGWAIAGFMGITANIMILSFYGVVGGWTMAYILKTFTGLMTLATEGKAGDAFGAFIANTPLLLAFQFLFMGLTIYIVVRGVAEGIERYCKFLMPALFLILIALIIRAVTLEGAGPGLNFYLKPDFSKLTGNSFLIALGQAFFSLSLGLGGMITYGSYLSKKENLSSSVFQVCLLDTSVAFLAGLAIFPTVFAFGVEPGAGPGLTFISLPMCFAKMPGGIFWCGLFFLLLFFAALTSSVAILEVPTAYVKDQWGWGRKKSAITAGVFCTLVGIPCALSLADDKVAIAGKGFFDVMDFLSANILLPLGGLLVCLFVGWFWHSEAKLEITNQGEKTFSLMSAWVIITRFIAPVLIGWIFISGLKW